MNELSICVTTFNRWGSCLHTLQSVCGQTQVSGLEVILIDDCSTDPLPSDVEKIISDNQVIFIRHEQNMGLAAARNSAIKQASGEYFAFCDDDDIWPDGLASRLLNSVQNGAKGAEMAFAMSDTYRAVCEPLLRGSHRLTDMIRHGITPPVSSQLYLTSKLREVGGYNEDVKSGVDHDLWISLAMDDLRVAVSWGDPAISCNDIDVDRMTTIEDRRRAKIADALKIWKPKIIQTFGEDFYQHFCFSYEQYLAYTFFIMSVRRGEYWKAGLKMLNRHVPPKLIVHIYKKNTGRAHCNVFPAYRRL